MKKHPEADTEASASTKGLHKKVELGICSMKFIGNIHRSPLFCHSISTTLLWGETPTSNPHIFTWTLCLAHVPGITASAQHAKTTSPGCMTQDLTFEGSHLKQVENHLSFREVDGNQAWQ